MTVSLSPKFRPPKLFLQWVLQRKKNEGKIRDQRLLAGIEDSEGTEIFANKQAGISVIFISRTKFLTAVAHWAAIKGPKKRTTSR